MNSDQSTSFLLPLREKSNIANGPPLPSLLLVGRVAAARKGVERVRAQPEAVGRFRARAQRVEGRVGLHHSIRPIWDSQLTATTATCGCIEFFFRIERQRVRAEVRFVRPAGPRRLAVRAQRAEAAVREHEEVRAHLQHHVVVFGLRKNLIFAP